MIRRSILTVALFALAVPIVSVANPPVSIRNLWAPAPKNNGNDLGKVKGTLYYYVNGESVERSLKSFGNGIDGKGIWQCVELIKRYAAALKISVKSGLGNGQDVAKKFATQSNGAFSFVQNGALNLPKPGAVLSVTGWDAVPEGHVGISCNYSRTEANSGMVKIKLFDQNMPVNDWKEITFKKTGGRWYGTMSNKGLNHKVVGWADPAG